MTPDQREAEHAMQVLKMARSYAAYHCQPGDQDAAALAILICAVELAAAGKSHDELMELLRLVVTGAVE